MFVLGNDPTLDENEDPLEKMRKGLEKKRPRSQKLQFFRPSDKIDSDEE